MTVDYVNEQSFVGKSLPDEAKCLCDFCRQIYVCAGNMDKVNLHIL